MLTREEFQILYEQGPDAVFDFLSKLQEQIVVLSARVKELEDRLGKDSHNSSKPPSSDGLSKKPVSLRSSSTRKPGGQPGHRGKRLEFCADPHQTFVHSPKCCQECGSDLEAVQGVAGERRQVYDLPPLQLLVTEHRVEHKLCPHCGTANEGTFPREATAQVQYGPRVKALGLYLFNFQLLPYQRIATLFADLFDAPLSPGMLCEAQENAGTALQPIVQSIQEALQKCPVVCFDETGFRVEGSLHWLHSASTASLSHYSCHKKRGKIGMDAAGVLPSFTGRAIHDGYKSYPQYSCKHGLCNAHHLRELTALIEQEGAVWARDLRHLLLQIKQAVERARAQGRTRLPVFEEIHFESLYRKLVREGLAANPPPPAVEGNKKFVKQTPSRNLLLRLHNHEDQVLAFMYDFSVPFDNNQAERDVRMMKVKQKISGTFRSEAGAEAFCRIRTYLSTLQKQGKNLLSALEQAFLRNADHS